MDGQPGGGINLPRSRFLRPQWNFPKHALNADCQLVHNCSVEECGNSISISHSRDFFLIPILFPPTTKTVCTTNVLKLTFKAINGQWPVFDHNEKSAYKYYLIPQSASTKWLSHVHKTEIIVNKVTGTFQFPLQRESHGTHGILVIFIPMNTSTTQLWYSYVYVSYFLF